ncbi:MAG: hypothetical protein COA32_09795 [Fluviicola sp.]|nr:MAG: hypothetical protein COA32_09795 [Fluviicola sp.]
MKLHSILSLSIVLAVLLSCSNVKNKFNTELADKMKLEVNFINNQMPQTDNSSSKYISFMILPESGSFEENWKATSLTASSDDLQVEILKFDKNEFEAKGDKVYRNNARMGLSELGSTIDITIVLVSDSGEQIKLSKSGIQEEIVQ